MKDKNDTCFLSGLPIRDGDPVAAVVLAANSPLSPPILGVRDGTRGIVDPRYGSEKHKKLLSMALGKLVLVDGGGTRIPTDDPAAVAEAVYRGGIRARGGTPAHLAMCHRKLYVQAVNAWPVPEDGKDAARIVPWGIQVGAGERKDALAAWYPLACLDAAMKGLNRTWRPMPAAAPLDARTSRFHRDVAWLLSEMLGEDP